MTLELQIFGYCSTMLWHQKQAHKDYNSAFCIEGHWHTIKGNYDNKVQWSHWVYRLGWSKFSKSSQIEPLFLYSMCIGDTRFHTKFQVSSLNILEWPPLFVNQSWHWESHLKWPESETFNLSTFIGIKNALDFRL